MIMDILTKFAIAIACVWAIVIIWALCSLIHYYLTQDQDQ